jgi:glycerol-3-phosphate dehydrogenase (NAD(P)+)
MKKNDKLAVLGGGLWGTVLAQQAARSRAGVVLWEYFEEAAAELGRTRRHPHIPGFRLDDAVTVTSDLKRAVADADVLLFVLPSTHVRRIAAAAAALLKRGAAVVNASKGVEPATLSTMGDAIAQELPKGTPVYTLTGPSFAREVARGIPTRLVLAGPAGARAKKLASYFEGGCLRLELSPDRRGAELGGSLKNVLAIGCGILDGLEGNGANTKAALIAQGVGELAALSLAQGGRRETAYGPAGLGDLIATGTSPESRNRLFGEKLGRGTPPEKAVSEIPTVVEGIEAAQSGRALSRKLKVRTPLIESIWGVVHAGKPAKTVLKALGF